MKKEWRIFLSAVMWMTRIRVPATIDHSPEYLQQAPRYFPLIGWIVGVISALTFLLFSRYISTDIGILASMIAGILVTGAFHEDGFADVCDGMGGYGQRQRVLEIMKDSRIGAYGAIGLIAILGGKYLLLKELPSSLPEPDGADIILFTSRYFVIALIAAHSVSRLMAVLVMQVAGYAGDPGTSKSAAMTGKRLSFTGLSLAVLFALAPFVFLPWRYLLAILPALYVTYALQRYFNRRIGGYTGDCLGAIQQVTEITIYLGFVIIFRYL
jgi:adenosylcobinamide-GDP ribazoletransferase